MGGKAALAAKKDEKQGKRELQEKRAIKAAVKSVEKDEKLKRPASAYWMWLNDNREIIRAALGDGHKITDVSKKGGEMWKALSDADREPWEKKAKVAKDTYEEYIKSAEGQAALKAYNDAAKAAKSEVSGKTIESKAPDANTPQKRGRQSKETESPAKTAPRTVKKMRGAKDTSKDILSEDIIAACKAATKEGEPSMEGLLRKLLGTEQLADKGLTPEKALEALKTSNGLLNKARSMIRTDRGMS